jgi:uncharacterized protein
LSFYLDTSLLVAVLTREIASGRATAWMRQHANETLLTSDWVDAEFSAALSGKQRARTLSVEARHAALATYRRLRAETLVELPVFQQHFRSAAHYGDQAEAGLRAGDALHIAIAAQAGATICTLDRRLAEAAQLLAVPAELI